MDNPDINFILGHPEDVTCKDFCDEVNALKWEISHVFVDEAHCCVTWSSSDFRPAFKQIAKLRSFFSSAKLVAMTATASKVMIKEIKDVLLMKSPVIIVSVPSRSYIKLCTLKREPTVGPKLAIEDTYRNLIIPYILNLCEMKRAYITKP